ncbi:MAG: hypothetical protein ACWA5P_01960 [bacterium]
MDEENKIKSSYYDETVPKLIEKYKDAIEQCLEIIGQKIDPVLSDDKIHNVLKAKRMAAENAKWFATEIDELERPKDDKEITEEKTSSTPINWTARQKT